ncbi:hypothetical protein [Carnobacterium maltaromaticum]|uniref:hypothetical protein n=1 Tax=Carnobacterium maltaromaticum TaxID=2751 RepID=UPI00295F1265|nr:hypothetical protein [Carnobacterium maltaromaticum]
MDEENFEYADSYDYFNRFIEKDFVEQVSEAAGVEWDEVPFPEEFTESAPKPAPVVKKVPLVEAKTESEKLIEQQELAEAQRLFLEEQNKEVEEQLAMSVDPIENEQDQPIQEEKIEESSLSEERLKVILQNHFLATEKLISSSLKIINTEAKTNPNMVKMIHQVFETEIQKEVEGLKAEINQIKETSGPIEDVKVKRTLRSFFSSAFKNFKQRFTRDENREHNKKTAIDKANDMNQAKTPDPTPAAVRNVPPISQASKVEQAVSKAVPVNVLRSTSKFQSFAEEQQKHLAQQNKAEVVKTVESSVQKNRISESELEYQLEQFYSGVENHLKNELDAMQQEQISVLEKIRDENKVNHTNDTIDSLTKKIEELETELKLVSQGEHRKTFLQKTKDSLVELGGNLQTAVNTAAKVPSKAVGNVTAFTNQFVDNRLEDLNNGLKKVTKQLDYRLATEMNKTIELDALELDAPPGNDYDKMLLNQLYTKYNEGLGHVDIDIQKSGVELNYSNKIKYIYDGQDCKKYSIDSDGKWAEQGSIYKSIDLDLILQETQDLMNKAVKYGVDSDEAFTEKDFRLIFHPDASEKEILNSIHNHRNEMIIDWVYNGTKSVEKIEKYEQEAQLNLVKHVVNGHTIYLMGEDMELLISASTKGPNDYQITSFDKVGPVSDFQAGSLAEVAEILKEKNAIPATKESLTLLNNLASKNSSNQMEKERQHNQVMQRTFKKEVGREMSR